MNNIKALRNKFNYSQAYIAKKLKISQQAYAKWETGEACPRTDKLLKLAEILQCTVDELLKGR